MGEQLVFKSEITLREWYSIIDKAKEYDAAEGESIKYSFTARDPEDKPPEEWEVLYWGRDGWKKGYIHGIYSVKRITDDANVFKLILEKEEDPRAQSLTATIKKTRSWIQSAINNARDKDRQDYDSSHQTQE